MARDAMQIKEKMISLFQRRGPSLPVHVAKETDLDMLFASAFLSELISERKLKVSVMKIGSSPLYFLPGQEQMLENFAEGLKGKEREAFERLKEKRFLVDSELEPAIRVAIGAIRDFAIPFRISGEIFWRYFTEDESKFIDMKFKERGEPKVLHKIQVVEKQPEKEIPIEMKVVEVVEIQTPEFEEPKIEIAPVEVAEDTEDAKARRKTKSHVKKTPAKKNPAKKSRQDEKFLEKVKAFLSKSSVEIKSVEDFKKEEIFLVVKVDGKEQLLAAYKKKKISDADIIRAAKRAAKLGMKYSVLSLGELPKKISELVEALKEIKEIGKME